MIDTSISTWGNIDPWPERDYETAKQNINHNTNLSKLINIELVD